MRLAVIPARGGSKRIPGKNIRTFHGKPIIAWSIEAAVNSGCFDKVVVSTDDPQIAEVARKFGAETPFSRPASLSDDHTPASAAVRHAVEWFNASGSAVIYCCCIYATAPFVTTTSLRAGMNQLMNTETDFVVSVASFPFPIQRACHIKDQRLVLLNPELYLTRSQDLEETFHDAGQTYWGTAAAWLEEQPLFGERTLPLIVPRYQVQDIDTLEDWHQAEVLFEAFMKEQS